MKILGLDEAGRGPVLGPLVICGYLAGEDKKERLRELGVKDSKLLAPKKREKLAPKLRRLADDYMIVTVNAKEIDKLRDVSNLNRIEIAYMKNIISSMRPDRVVIDSPETNTKNFNKKIMNDLENRNFQLVSENFADKNHIEVAAASVLAKVHRDKEISRLHKKHGFFGSGYASDPRTIGFLKDWLKKNKELPYFVRKSWATAAAIGEEAAQAKVAEFICTRN